MVEILLMISLSLAGASVIIIGAVLLRRFPDVTLLNVTTISSARTLKKKEEIAHERILRARRSVKSALQQKLAPWEAKIRALLQAVYERAIQLEKKYELERSRMFRPRGAKNSEELQELIQQGQILLNEGKRALAEEKFIKVIAIDPKNTEAYHALAEIYLSNNELDHAEEIARFLIKLRSADATAHALLARVARAKGLPKDASIALREASRLAPKVGEYRFNLAQMLFAAGSFREAVKELKYVVEREPENPKYLDFLIEASILAGDAGAAKAALLGLRTANKENGKIKEFARRIRQMK